jgi:hypothetical protein
MCYFFFFFVVFLPLPLAALPFAELLPLAPFGSVPGGKT